MGVLCDYFHAADAEAVAELMAHTGGESPLTVHDGQPEMSGVVEAEGIDPTVAEGPWVLDVGEVALRALAGLAAARIPELVGRLPNTDPQWLGGTLESLAALARQALAGGRRLYCWVSL